MDTNVRNYHLGKSNFQAIYLLPTGSWGNPKVSMLLKIAILRSSILREVEDEKNTMNRSDSFIHISRWRFISCLFCWGGRTWVSVGQVFDFEKLAASKLRYSASRESGNLRNSKVGRS